MLHSEWHLGRFNSFLAISKIHHEVLGLKPCTALHWRWSAKFPTALSAISAKFTAAKLSRYEIFRLSLGFSAFFSSKCPPLIQFASAN